MSKQRQQRHHQQQRNTKKCFSNIFDQIQMPHDPHVIVLVPQEHVAELQTDWLIGVLMQSPVGGNTGVAFDGYISSYIDASQVEQVRKFVKKALSECPQLLTHLTVADRALMRRCAVDNVIYNPATRSISCTSEDCAFWLDVTSQAGVNPWE